VRHGDIREVAGDLSLMHPKEGGVSLPLHLVGVHLVGVDVKLL
jgi:hypothetical protein